MSKRDGSHWEFFNCPKEMSEERQTVQVVCTVDGPESNCGEIFEGGVEYTVVEMPEGCGPGKYAMAVSLEVSQKWTSLPHRLEKRLGRKTRIYDFTFDYDFTAVNKRASTVRTFFVSLSGLNFALSTTPLPNADSSTECINAHRLQ